MNPEKNSGLEDAGADSEMARAVELVDRATGVPPGGFRRGRGRDRRRVLGGVGSSHCYHVMSRIRGGDKLLGPAEKDAFLRIARRMEGFSGLTIVTHAVMANHFHLLVRVPDQERFLEQFDGEKGEERLMEHLGRLYSVEHMMGLRAELEDLRKREMAGQAEELLGNFRRRLCNLPLFVKELKERFSRWFNKVHGHEGTLWMSRFKSVLVQDGEALRTIACYIDLNPVRAGLVEDPMDYRWCGYAEAVAGSELARRGLCQVSAEQDTPWDKDPGDDRQGPRTPAMLYRSWLFERGVESKMRKGFSKARRDEARSKEGRLTRGELLQCRVRYFSDGVAIGGRDFVEAIFRERRDSFGENRRTGARGISEAPDLGLFTLRALRVRAVE